jgi:thiol-disulfide isomerase/thioredoxin
MVDWERVEELRSKGWDWDRIADDPKVGFHPDSSVQPGRALRGLYHRQRSRARRQGDDAPRAAAAPSKQEREKAERKWTLPRIGYLLVPIFAIWFLLAYLVPSPVGLVLPAIPYLALGLVVVAFVLLFGLFRSSEPRWSRAYRTTLVTGVVIGLVLSGVIALGGILFFGCPVLPGSGTTQPGGQGWISVSASAWQDGGKPVVYFYGATWCPYCSASSWAVWKALTEFGTVSGEATSYSSPSDVYASTPEMVLAGISLSNSPVSFQVSEDTSNVDGTFPGTSNCVQQAYVSAYSGSSIPFVAINGHYIHGGSSLTDPASLSSYAGGNNGGAGAVQSSVSSESGAPWSAVQTQAWWIMAFMAKSTGDSVSSLASQYHWSAATQSAVASDYGQIS